MTILALDLGTKCGWAIRWKNGTYDSGTWDLSVGRYEGGGMRFVRFRKMLRDVIEAADLVAYEEVRRHMGTDAAHIYGGLQAVLQEECESRTPKVPYMAVPVGTIKKHATGRGNAPKALMIEMAEQLWPDQAIADDNQADALHLARAVVDGVAV